MPGRENRAIAGLSMGSSIAANVEVKRLDVFASVVLLSSGMFRNSPGGWQLSKRLLLLFSFSSGTEDDRISALKTTWDDLNARKINFVAKLILVSTSCVHL
jgi:S-formylglutathione hydrolase FrmB